MAQQHKNRSHKTTGDTMPPLIPFSARLLAATVAFTFTSLAGAAVVLPRYNVSNADVSVSGLSSGGYMAAQLHFAYSKTIRKGAGIIAGGPVYCSQGNVAIATGPCTIDNGSRNLPYLISTVNTWSGNGYIDPTANLAASKVYLFSGTLDSTVKQAVMNDLKTMYGNYVSSANIVYKNTIAAEHAMPTDYNGNPCSVNASPYISNCNVDAAGDLLKWIHGTLNAKNAGTLGGTFINFDQKGFWGNADPTTHGMANDGWAYVPANCAAGQPCKLHVALHGCKQNVATVGTQYYKNAGYNRWADTNNMIVLYPQASPTSANPNGCWDWYGYDDVNFPGKSGGQMVAIKTMIDRITSGNVTTPFNCAHWYGSNYAHVSAGRAYASGGNAYAVNSNQYLGYYSIYAYTDVRNTSSGFYAYGSCT
ncbi:MAG: poly(3-hydroxybutyrate) depolymerase [Bradyrhizobium sp.]|jgi:poly(3-hydroxybutyrate) depolymerase